MWAVGSNEDHVLRLSSGSFEPSETTRTCSASCIVPQISLSSVRISLHGGVTCQAMHKEQAHRNTQSYAHLHCSQHNNIKTTYLFCWSRCEPLKCVTTWLAGMSHGQSPASLFLFGILWWSCFSFTSDVLASRDAELWGWIFRLPSKT